MKTNKILLLSIFHCKLHATISGTEKTLSIFTSDYSPSDTTSKIDEEQCNTCTKYDYPNYNKGEANA